MYHLSSSSPRNLLTTGDPTFVLSHEPSNPKSKTNPLVLVEDENGDGIGENSEKIESFEERAEGSVGFEFKFGSTVEFCCFSLSVVSVSAFVEQRVMGQILLLLELEVWR